MRTFDIYCSQRRSFLFLDTSLTQRRLSKSYPLNWFQDFYASGSPETFYLEKRMHSNLVIHNPTLICFPQQPQHSCHRFLFFLVKYALFWLFIWLFINLAMRKQTLVSSRTTRFHFLNKWHSGGCQYSQSVRVQKTSQILSARRFMEEWSHGYFCLGFFSSSTHFDLVIRLAQKAWRHCFLAFVRDLGSRDGNWYRSPCENWPFS